MSRASTQKYLHKKKFILLVLLPLFEIKCPAKIVLKLLSRPASLVSILTLLAIGFHNSYAQVGAERFNRSNPQPSQSDSIAQTDSIVPVQKKAKKQAIEEPVFYSANDSMSILVNEQQVLLWGSGKITYQDIELTSEYIVSNLANQEINAVGGIDTSGKYFGNPNFKKGKEEFDSDSIYYNIKTGKGIIYNVKSKQDEGYLHSDLTKRDTQGHIHMKGGKYTTCDLDHPHFYMALTKAIAIPNDKIISGPAYLVLEDVPIPLLGLPFGFFPSSSKRAAGIIIPRYGEEQNRGFYLQNGGWYQPLGQYLDMQLLGDIYSKGSYALKWGSNYKVRYRFNGTTKIDYNVNKDNSNNSFEESQDFRWVWNHRQDPKSNPTQSFSANVNFSSSGFDKNNSYNYNDVVTTQKSSSISYTKSFPGTPFNLAVSANARQNTADSTLVMDLPTAAFNATTIYPFRQKAGTGKLKWYENVGFSYRSEFLNKIDIRDTMLFESQTWDELNYGFKHDIPFVLNLKSDKIKMLTVSPGLSYSGAMNSWYTKKHTEIIGNEQVVVTDTVRQTTYAHAINPSISVGLTPKITGMFVNSRADSRLVAIRHVMQPRASFSYVPDMSSINPNYFDTVFYTSNGELQYEAYSYYENNLYKSPSFAKESGSLSLGLSNNLEMKLKPKNDTAQSKEMEKVSLLRTLNVTTSYNPFIDEFKWSAISLNGNTSLFKDILSLNLTARFDPYDYITDTAKGKISYKRENEFYYNHGKGLARFVNLNLSTSFRLRSKQTKGSTVPEPGQESSELNPYQDPFNTEFDNIPGSIAGSYVDFSIPWSLNVNHTYSIARPYKKQDQETTNTVNLSGDFSLTQKWKVGFNTGYDIEEREMTITNININRDLHCWMMSFSIVPFGSRRSYNFTINAKANILRDLKWDKRQNWYDNF